MECTLLVCMWGGVRGGRRRRLGDARDVMSRGNFMLLMNGMMLIVMVYGIVMNTIVINAIMRMRMIAFCCGYQF